MAAIAVEALTAGYCGRPVLAEIAFEVPQGQMLGLVGPNGCGKSTLLRTLARLIPPLSGRVLLEGVDVASLSGRERAARQAVLPQSPSAPEGITVRELVTLGRHPHRRLLARVGAQDCRAVDEALGLAGMEGLEEREVAQLSGGERQRAWLAMALAQETPVLLLDEPTTYLDLGHQLEVLELISWLRRERGLTVVMVLHDLNQAAAVCDRLLALHRGGVVADGPPGQVLTATFAREIFGVEGRVVEDEGKPLLIARSSVAGRGAALAQRGGRDGRVPRGRRRRAQP